MKNTDIDETRRLMQCMEVWGGNVETDRQLQTSGLDVWISSEPEGQSEAGGDVYYVSSCASGRITRLLLADVSGHGDIVSASAKRLRDLMRQNVNKVGHQPFVASMNRHFTEATNDWRFATAIVSSFFSSTSSLSLCNAGHPPPLVFRAAGQTWNALDEANSAQTKPTTKVADLPFGIAADTPYREYTTHLAKGDMVLCYTDAFTESYDANGNMLGVEGLLSVVSSFQASRPEALIPDVIELVRSLSPGNLEQDDATILLFRANRKASSIRDTLLAPIRLFGSVADKSRIQTPSASVAGDLVDAIAK